jgi:hypothetical protein
MDNSSRKIETVSILNNRNDSAFPTAIQQHPLNDPGVTIIASGIPVTETEDIMQKAEDLIRTLGDNDKFRWCQTKNYEI